MKQGYPKPLAKAIEKVGSFELLIQYPLPYAIHRDKEY
jgi:hypothetical protein